MSAVTTSIPFFPQYRLKSETKLQLHDIAKWLSVLWPAAKNCIDQCLASLVSWLAG